MISPRADCAISMFITLMLITNSVNGEFLRSTFELMTGCANNTLDTEAEWTHARSPAECSLLCLSDDGCKGFEECTAASDGHMYCRLRNDSLLPSCLGITGMKSCRYFQEVSGIRWEILPIYN
jgi:hypothetical protein